MQFGQRRRFEGFQLTSVDFFGTDLTETLSQAIRQAEEDSLAENEDQEANVLFGSIKGSVVGLRYYTGVVNKGEMISLVREPHNPYDRNAVMVANVYGNQVGHIRRQLAAPLAEIMDNKLARVEGVVPFRANNAFTMPVHLLFWGKDENRAAVVNELASHGFKLDSASQGAKGAARAGNTLDRIWSGSRKPAAQLLTAEQLKNAFDELFDDLMEDKTREMEAAEAICTPLLPHQKQALAWMTSRENSDDLPPFWKEENGHFFNVLTNFAVRERPDQVFGGILADDMGLGKTLTTIALILTNFRDGKPLPLQKCTAVPKMKTSRSRAADSKTGKDSALKGKDSVEEIPQASASTSHSKRHHEDEFRGPGEGEVPGKKVKKKENPGTSSKKASGCRSLCFTASATLTEDADFAAALGGFQQGAYAQNKKAKGSGSGKKPLKGKEGSVARATLIVCPLSVLGGWLDQFEQHVCADVNMNTYAYYGSERNRDPQFLAQQDVVLTTYNVLSADYGNNRSSPLHTVNWLRVVLDEGHVVRNPNALQSKAVLALKAERRWILSGTPIQNSLKDLWMLVAFLKLKPFDVWEWWNRVIQRPVTLGDNTGLKNLQALVKGITLRRTKTSRVGGRPVVKLPEKKVFVQHVILSEEERQQYEKIRMDGRAIIGRYFREGTVLTNYADVLAILLRLRQLCCHPQLLGGSGILATVTTDGTKEGECTPSELRARLLEKITLVLSSGSDEECAVCLESIRQPVITYCAHVYCKPCICEVIRTEKDDAKCPLCRAQINSKELVEYPGKQEDLDSADSKDTWMSSSKVNALMAHLHQLRSQDPSIKSLVVSQFTRFLSQLEVPLREQGFIFTRLDGSMNQKKRESAIQAFQDPAPGSPTIMLLSLKAGGVGLNLTAASRVFLMDPAWNPAAEEQCFDRCHRLGQKKDVVITKFIVKDSVEENMARIQEKKQKLVEKAFGAANAQERKQSRIEDIRVLMEL
ncbi:helicase-like transcription factor isoform X3 [Brienomyrus brachyistius]|uniref:helicase-like transcription factor isoform X3 n=1 Tax=Brienomyrus brachyistius TaxID=42636 RepID=UPI0020B3FBE7|nr:helicase-like transcription factor isoform X3 [Brienomyrus brachyistius]